MSVKTQIHDGKGTGNRARVSNHQLHVNASVSRQYPPLLDEGTENKYRYLSGLLGSTGVDSGTTSMNVDGSSTAQEFYIEADNDYDIFVTDIVILVADGVVSHAKFGGVTALTNGWTLKIAEAGLDTNIIYQAKTVGEIMAQATIFDTFGSGGDASIITNYSGTDDAFIGVVQLDEILANGLRLGRGSLNRVTAVVNDDLTGLANMSVRILGYRHYP